MSYDKVEQKLDDQMRKMYYGAQPSIYGQTYFYVLGFTKVKHRKVFWGPMSSDDSYRALGELADGERFELTTRDPHRAVREVRDLMIKRGTDPDEALRRLLHKRDTDVEQKQSIASKLFRNRLRPNKTKTIAQAERPPQRIIRVKREE